MEWASFGEASAVQAMTRKDLEITSSGEVRAIRRQPSTSFRQGNRFPCDAVPVGTEGAAAVIPSDARAPSASRICPPADVDEIIVRPAARR
jgi:hypothetical protein